jgi:hypothetical protein
VVREYVESIGAARRNEKQNIDKEDDMNGPVTRSLRVFFNLVV